MSSLGGIGGMARPLRCLFVTYAIDAWPFGPTMIGVLKRFLRLVREMPAGEVEPLWLHAGPFPVQDPLVRELLPRIGRYDWRGTRLTSPPGRVWQVRGRGGALAAVPVLAMRVLAGDPFTPRRIRGILRRARPDLVVLGEAPQSGFLRRVSDAAWELRLPQVAIDNFLSDFHAEHLVGSFPHVDGWLLLGVPQAETGELPDRVVPAPPLLAPAAPAGPEREDPADVTILGYDPRVAGLGLDFLSRLPAGTVGRLVSASLSPRGRRRCEVRAGGRRLLFSALPGEAEYRGLIEATGLVFCKNGFQQMAESLALGTPVVACRAFGGVAEETLDQSWCPFLRFLPRRTSEWDGAVAAARGWLANRPAMPWRPRMAALADPARHGAGLLAGLLERVAQAGARP